MVSMSSAQLTGTVKTAGRVDQLRTRRFPAFSPDSKSKDTFGILVSRCVYPVGVGIRAVSPLTHLNTARLCKDTKRSENRATAQCDVNRTEQENLSRT